MKKERLYRLYADSEFTIRKAQWLAGRGSSEHEEFCQVAYTHQMLGLSCKYEKEFSLLLNSKHELGEPVVARDSPWLCLSYQDSASVLQSKISLLFENANKLYDEQNRHRYKRSTNEKPLKFRMSLPVSVIWQSSIKPNPDCTDKFILKAQNLIAMQGWEKCENTSRYHVTRTNDYFTLTVNVAVLSMITFNFTSTYVKGYIDFLNGYEESAPYIQSFIKPYIAPYNSIKIQLLQWLHDALSTIESQSSHTLLRIPYFENSLAHLLMNKKADDLFETYPYFKLVLKYYLKRLLEKTVPLIGYFNSNHLDLNLPLLNEQSNNPWDVLSDVLASIHEHDLYHDKKAKTLLDENDLNSLVLHSLKQRGLRTQKELPVGKNRVDVVFDNGEFNIRCECKIAYKDSKLDKKGIEKAITLQAPSYVANNPGSIETGIVFYLYGDNKKKAMDELSKYIGELGYLFAPKGGRNQMRYKLSSGNKVIEPNPINVICVFFESKSNTVLSREPKK
ncbi:MAG: hypothetical protein ACTH4J_16645 [Vibrio toranzoniae]|uniref:hypothetical protein n=1 Tax=Vibrio toranzoniae TaxID=1194427 RepID=UPI003F95A237